MGRKKTKLKTGKKKNREHDGLPMIDNTGGRFYIDELIIRDRDWDRIFKMHDKELGNALKGVEKFINDKYQMPTTISYDELIKFNFGKGGKKR